MTIDMLHVMEWHNGDKAFRPFSDDEMARRHALIREWMARHEVGAVLFTSPPSVTYFSGWRYRAFGRKYAMVVTPDSATTITSGTDGGNAWRNGYGHNMTYTDWRRDNFYRAVRQSTAGVRRLAIEFDHVSLDFRRLLDAALPGVEMVDIGLAATWMRIVKSDEELALIRSGAAICDAGAKAALDAIRHGVPEFEVVLASDAAMSRAISARFPHVEPGEGWTFFQSGIQTDGAHNAATNRRIQHGDILSLSCNPVLFGYLAALGRTLFLGEPDKASRDIWEKNVAVHRRGLELVRPGARCNEIAADLNAMYRDFGLLKRRSYGYGHSGGIVCPYSSRDSVLELREDVVTELRPGMVVSMEPMVMLPQGMAGAGGYREQDMLIVTACGAERLSDFPAGPEHNIIPC